MMYVLCVYFEDHGLLGFSCSLLKSRSRWPHGLRLCVCGRSLAEIVGSNPTGSKEVCLLRMFCVVSATDCSEES